MEHLSNDCFQHCLEFLADDGISIGRLSLCSSRLYNRIKDDYALWKLMYNSRWTTALLPDELEEEYRIEYYRRHAIDMHVSKLLQGMAKDLQRILHLEENEASSNVDGNPRIGQAWDHVSWNKLLMYRDEISDILRTHARMARFDQPNSSTVSMRLFGFLACRCLQNIQFGECLLDWKQLAHHDERQMGDYNLILMERYSVLICEIQLTPDEQLNAPKANIEKSISSELDEIAEICRQRIRKQSLETNETMLVTDQLLLVKDILVKEYKFAGNTENYYDYRNSLLNHVLKTRQGIPITLCILFACVCRRLKIHTFLVGLPGHVVLGFQDSTLTDENGFFVSGETLYLDVFRTGQILSAGDCQLICNSYGLVWDDQFLRPVTASQALNRTFNNLSNCHLKAMGDDSTISPFSSDLFFQQRALASIHRQPKSIAGPLVDRIINDLPLTLSSDLLGYYGLLSSPDRPDMT